MITRPMVFPIRFWAVVLAGLLAFYFSNEAVADSCKYKKEIDDLKKSYITDGYDILLYLGEKPDLDQTRFDMLYFSKDKLSLPTLESIERIDENTMEVTYAAAPDNDFKGG